MADNGWEDYYHLLKLCDSINKTGKGPDSTPAEIKRAYRQQSKIWHDDMGGAKKGTPLWEHANEQMRLVNAAKETLLDPAKKATYDREWHKKNPWFKGQGSDEETSSELPEIAIRWDPPDALNNLFYNIPRGAKRQAKLHITPRVGKGFLVEIKKPKSGWLKVISPKGRRATVPFIAEIEVDTSGLAYGAERNEELEFVLEDL